MAWSFVQAAGPTLFSSSPNSQAYGSNNGAGNLLICAVSLGTGASAITVTDTAGNIWAQAGGFVTEFSQKIGLFYVLSAKGGANTVSANFTGGAGTCQIGVAEFSPGAGNVASLDAIAGQFSGTTGGGGGSGVVSGAFTPAGAGELLVFSASDDTAGQIWTAGSGYTLPVGWTNVNIQLMAEYNLACATGSQTAAITNNGTGHLFQGTGAAFIAAASSGGPPGGFGPVITPSQGAPAGAYGPMLNHTPGVPAGGYN